MTAKVPYGWAERAPLLELDFPVAEFSGRIARIQAALEESEAEALLVLGSSLAVYSGYRFVKRAHERGLPIAIITLGQTRADALAHVRADQKIGDLLPIVARNWLTRCASDSQSTNHS